MNTNLLKLLNTALAAGMIVANQQPALAQYIEQSGANPPPVPAEELPAGSQVLASGPVHEAFAKPVTMDPQAPVIVPNQPPANLEEMPPAEKPAGDDIVWVPGYWAWDADRNDFIWISGCWRNPPPNTYWVPGYWLQAGNGWQWISGFWKPFAPQPQQEIEYLPAPPASFEVEPPGAPPSPDQIWVPGCWYWSEGRYIQRRGYWIVQNAGWVWVPAHFAWTPRGYIFCPGHWDHDLDDRGVLFTPAYFPPDVRVRTEFVFSPSICVDLGILRLNFFCYPRYRHYYFGDYYDDGYRRVGIYPWYQCQTVHIWYDPLFVYDRWHFRRTNPRWAENQAHEFAMRRSNRDLRPARTFTELQIQTARMPAARRPERPLLQPIKSYAASQSTSIKFERISTEERQKITVKTREVTKFRDQRNRWEGPAVQPSAGSSVTRQVPAVTRQVPAKEPKAEPARQTRSEPETVTIPRGQSKKTARETKQAEVESASRVRVTSPEREVVPTQNIPRQSEPRYIQKEPPTRPSQEQERSRQEPTSGQGNPGDKGDKGDRGGSDRDSRGKSK